ncbi:transglycosylase domain-containing protein [Fusobacterium necrogenes]|uniref:transglycosylase domain-containing protein n=1 Tax=Fusobacterium necrogenes TaxID=858 RepID=UPI00255CBB3C|nr:transglycosylase domain-containing protein [Fusobacterium necrogenes]
MKKFTYLKVFIAVIFLGGVIASGAVFGVVYKYYKELPDISTLIEDYSPSIPTTVYDRKGRVIDVISREKRETAKFREIPQNLKNAFLAIEDKKFYFHHGIHFKRLLGAIVANIKSGSAVQGASSFTQQLARNAFLSHEKSIARKIKEALITFEIERKYTKDEIFEKYLNEIYFGAGAYGVKTAAEQFYRKDISQINLAEAALLAGIPNRPETYNPSKKLNNSLKRMRLILSEMYKDKMITKDEYDRALAHKFYNENNLPKDFILDEETTVIYNKRSEVEYNVPDFSGLVKNILLENFSEDLIYTGGLKVYTTLDLDMQKIAKESFENYAFFQKDGREKLQGGMVTVDPNNGHIISIVAGKKFKDGDFNRATMARRQLGSSFKPFLYFTALQNGYELNSVIEDRYLQYGNWIPKNYGNRYNKNLTLLTALDRSVNTVSIQLLDKVGINVVQKNMQKLDPNLKIPDNLTASLGSFENTPLQHALNYSVFANGGYKVAPVIVTSVSDKYGNVLYEQLPQKEKIYDSLDISLVTYMLKSSVMFGSSGRAAVYDSNKNRIEQGGKTGTTNENRTLWFAGITPNYVTTIYIGYDDNSPIIGNVSGGNGVAPLWAEYYQKLVDKNLYNTKAKFSFLDNHLKNGDLVLQTLALNSGLKTDKGRDFVLRKGKIELERDDKYFKGIAGIFEKNGYKVTNINTVTESEWREKEEKIDKNINLNSKSNSNTNDSLFKRLLGE